MRLVFWVGALTVGVAAAAMGEIPVRLVAVGVPVAALAVIVLWRRGYSMFATAILFGALGAYVGARAVQPAPLSPALATVVDREVSVAVKGWMSVAPEAAGEGARLRVSVERLDDQPAQATIALAVTAGVPDVLPGDAVLFAARLRSVRGLANPGVADAALQARASGIDGFASVPRADSIRRWVDARIGWRQVGVVTFLRAAARVRLALGRAIDRVARDAPGALLHTAVLGERRGTDPRVEDGFRAAGATHVLSVSGLHLAAIAFLFFAGLRRLFAALPRLPLWLDPRGSAALVALPAIAFYTAVTGNAVATVRSALMMGFGLLGVAIGRRGAPLGSVAIAVAILIGWSPLVLFDVSFQLSVVSVAALALLASRLAPARVAPDRSWLTRAGAWVGRLGAATVAAGVATAPLCAHHFGEITPAAPLGNLLLVPLVEMVVVPFGLAGAALGSWCGTPWGRPLLLIAVAGARAALAVAERFRVIAPVWLTRAPNVFETAALSVGAVVLLAALPRAAVFRRFKLGTAGVCLGAAVLSLVVRDFARRWDRNVVITFLDVGQGDAAVIQAPGGHTILIDGGGTYDGSFDPGARVVEPFLRARGITRLDLVALSHPHPDHLGGLHRIVARFPVGALWTSGDDGHNPEYHRLLAEAQAHGVGRPVPARWERGGLVLEPLGPFVADAAGGHVGPPEGTSVNDASLVLRASFGARAALFTGDIEADGEGELAGRTALGQAVASDLLKVPHHGSRTSSSDELLDAVRPSLAVMSLGWLNRFHFPRAEVIARYQRRGTRVLRTDLDGAITVVITPEGEMRTTCVRGCR